MAVQKEAGSETGSDLVMREVSRLSALEIKLTADLRQARVDLKRALADWHRLSR